VCGICGFISKKNINIKDMVQSIIHRGPDFQGVYKDGLIALGHTRLSILDLSENANQPMISKSGRCVIAYNGEVYNYQALKNELEKEGVTFRTHSDTEVILEGFERWGTLIFEKLNGMFSFSVYDKSSRKMFLVKDRFGIKPLYYTHKSGELIFGSEMKAIFASNVVTKKLCYQGFNEYLHYSSTLGEMTFYDGIVKLLPGHYIEFSLDDSAFEIKEYALNYNVQPSSDPLNVSIDKVRMLVENAVKRQLVSDVPVGVFLSGGIDSTAITAFASKHYSGKLKTFSAGFDFDKGVNELPNARYVAKYFGTDHHEFHIRGDDIPGVLESLNGYFDQPFGDAANIPLYLMSRELKGKQKVILQGDGGDELFAGYHRYRRLHYYSLIKLFAKGMMSVRSLIPKNHPRYKNLRSLYALHQKDRSKEMAYIMSQEMFDEDPVKFLSHDLQTELKNVNPFKQYQNYYGKFQEMDPVQRMLFTDMNIILPDLYFEKVDRATMANSLEIRVPMLDNDLALYAMSLPSKYKIKGKETKYLLKKAFAGIVPDKILYGPKLGFSVPFQYWLKTTMKDYMFDMLHTNMEFFSDDLVRCMNEHVNNEKDNGYILWKMLNLSIWFNENKNIVM